MSTYIQVRKNEGIQLDGAEGTRFVKSWGGGVELGGLGKEVVVCKGVGDWAQRFLLGWRWEMDGGFS